MAGSLARLKQRDINERPIPLTRKGPLGGPGATNVVLLLEWHPVLPSRYVCLGLSNHSYLLVSKRATKKISVQSHRPHRRIFARSRSRKHNKINSRASEGVGSFSLSDRDCHNDQNSRGTAVNLVASLKACTLEKDIHRGIEIHKAASRSGLLKKNVFIGTALVNLYAKCGTLLKAQEVFDELPVRNEVSWTALLTGYGQFGYIKEAFSCFEQMQREGIYPNAITFCSILKACAVSRNLDKGQEIHTYILREHLIADHILVGNALVDMYAKCGALQKAQEVFNELQSRDVVSWNALITGYSHCGHGKEALNCFDQMQQAGLSPNAVTFIGILKACGSMGACDRGEVIHALITREHLLETHSEVTNALVDMYAKCGAFEKALTVLDQSPHNVVSWTALITGYVQHGFGKEALNCFELMQSEGFFPDAFTFACILKACAHMKALKKGQEVHAQILRMQLLENDDVIASALVDMYGKCGALEKAEEIFDELSGQGVFLWNTLISAYAHHDLVDETWNRFKQMQDSGCSPDEVTFACVLKACGSSGAAHKGQRIHAEILRRGFYERGNTLCLAVLNMYASCGMIDKAELLFNKMQVCDSVSWGALMVGYSQLGNFQNVLYVFDKMIAEGIKPEPVLLTIILNACSKVGQLSEGQLYFEWVVHAFNIMPTLEHQTCVVSLFGSAGHLDECLAVIEAMLFPVDLTIWHTLLVICQKLGSMKLARWAFKHAVHLNEEDAAAYVFTSNMFVDI